MANVRVSGSRNVAVGVSAPVTKHQRAGLGDRAEAAGDADASSPTVGRASIARPAPLQSRSRTPASTRPRADLASPASGGSSRAPQGNAPTAGGIAVERRDALDRARHVGRALRGSAATRSAGIAGRGPWRVRGHIGVRIGARRVVRSAALPSARAHAREHRIARLRDCRRSPCRLTTRVLPCARSRRAARCRSRSPRSTPRRKSGCAGRRPARGARNGCRRARRCPPRAAVACGTLPSPRSRCAGTLR